MKKCFEYGIEKLECWINFCQEVILRKQNTQPEIITILTNFCACADFLLFLGTQWDLFLSYKVYFQYPLGTKTFQQFLIIYNTP